jgi:small-conductance mechanosensitive channel
VAAKDFSKIVSHPEKTEIITKLVNGESTKNIAQYLKDKYSKPDEGHLRISASLLQEFLDSYGDEYVYAKKIIQKDADSKLDKKIAESLLDNRAWKERLVQTVDKQVNYLDKIDHLITILETRAEQLFDFIQSDPENTKTDYIFTKYLEQLMLTLEKADKIRNDKPDIRIEHSYTVQMVEQQSAAFQEAIRRVLDRLGPDYASMFMDMLGEELNKINPKTFEPVNVPVVKQFEESNKEIDKMEVSIQELDSAFETVKKESNEPQ